MLKAAVNLYHDKKYDEVENDLDKALKTGVRTENNISIIHIMHARLYTRLKQYAKAGESLQKAKDIPHKRMLDNDMENLGKEIIELENKKRQARSKAPYNRILADFARTGRRGCMRRF